MTPDPPVTRYKLTVTVYGNTLAEVDDELHMTANAFYPLDVCAAGPPRDAFTVTGGRSSRVLEHTNPEMTPERYTRELSEWAHARGFIRAARAAAARIQAVTDALAEDGS